MDELRIKALFYLDECLCGLTVLYRRFCRCWKDEKEG